jgi:phosphoribosylglycinamide formyltransferase 1
MMTKIIEPIRLAVFASGRGSNFEAILKNIEKKALNARVTVVISNISTAGALEIAQKQKISNFHISQKLFQSEKEYVDRLLSVLKEYKVQLIILAGYLKIIPAEIIRQYKNKILNIHPALLPSFGGQGLYGHHVHEAVLNYGCKVSGATVHIVDERYDTGTPIVQHCVPVLETDTPDSLAARVLTIEHKIYSEAIQLFADDRIRIEGRKVRIIP